MDERTQFSRANAPGPRANGERGGAPGPPLGSREDSQQVKGAGDDADGCPCGQVVAD